MDCIFCQIADGTIPAKLLYEDATVVAFADMHPQAPVHVLVIPREHVSSMAAAGPEHETLLGHLLLTAAEVARAQGLDDGYRLVVNTGVDGGQTVEHLHVHVLGGRAMHWPPG
jgi:histidine triad (HIT) family protein